MQHQITSFFTVSNSSLHVTTRKRQAEDEEDGNEQQNEQEEDVDRVEKSDKVRHFQATWKSFSQVNLPRWKNVLC